MARPSNYQLELRRALLDAVGPEDVSRLAKCLLRDAEGGDIGAARTLLEQLVGKPRGEVIRIDVPDVDSERNALQAQRVILAAVARGDLSVEAGSKLSEVAARAAEASLYLDLRERLERREGLSE